jgi:hypothetical protein
MHATVRDADGHREDAECVKTSDGRKSFTATTQRAPRKSLARSTPFDHALEAARDETDHSIQQEARSMSRSFHTRKQPRVADSGID